MSVLTVQHDEVACYGSKNHCCWHNVDEPDMRLKPCQACGGQGGLADVTVCTDCLGEGVLPRQAFQCCLECRHVYMTEQDLRDAWAAECPEVTPWNGWQYGCAYCSHDFLCLRGQLRVTDVAHDK